MKTVVIVHLIAGLMYVSGLIWTIAEALNYYIKDDPFNWGSLVLLVSGIVLLFINIIVAIFRKF